LDLTVSVHNACFRGASWASIEALAVSNPEWITMRNNAGYSPLQILCKNGRIDDRIITLFSRIAGPEIFSTVDMMGNTPLHSFIRRETDLESLRALLRAYPDALYTRTMYDDTPLHLACFRSVDPEVVREVALASSFGLEKALAQCNGRVSPLLLENTAGQTPIGIVMEEFRRTTPCTSSGINQRAFDILKILVNLLQYGPAPATKEDPHNLVAACVALHRRGVRLDPSFIRQVIRLHPEEVKVKDAEGNYPLHVEASIPIEKMSLLDGSSEGCPHNGTCYQRTSVLRCLLEIHPEAVRHQNNAGAFPLGLMIHNGRPWNSTMAFILQNYPPAFHTIPPIERKLIPQIVEKYVPTLPCIGIVHYLLTMPPFYLCKSG
jgi:hypothetical protein